MPRLSFTEKLPCCRIRMDDTQDQFTKSTSEKRSVSDQEGDERSQKRVRVDDQQSSQLTGA